MDKAFFGSARFGYARFSVYRPDFERLVKKVESQLGGLSLDVTRRALTLGVRDSTTGWYAKEYTESTIEMLIFTKGTTPSLLPPGSYVRYDALGITLDPVEEGDQIKDREGVYWKVMAVTPVKIGDSLMFYNVDLTKLPFGD